MSRFYFSKCSFFLLLETQTESSRNFKFSHWSYKIACFPFHFIRSNSIFGSLSEFILKNAVVAEEDNWGAVNMLFQWRIKLFMRINVNMLMRFQMHIELSRSYIHDSWCLRVINENITYVTNWTGLFKVMSWTGSLGYSYIQHRNRYENKFNKKKICLKFLF